MLLAVVGSNGVERPQIKPGKARALETTFGEVTVERTAHATRRAGALYPVDAGLNLPTAKYTDEVEQQVAMSAARKSFCATLLSLKALMRAHVCKRQAEAPVQRVAGEYEAFYAETGFEVSSETSELLVLSFDQKGVVMKLSDLTKATQKTIQASRPKHASRRSKDEPNRGRKPMAIVSLPLCTQSRRICARPPMSSRAGVTSARRCRLNDQGRSTSVFGRAWSLSPSRWSRPRSTRQTNRTRRTASAGWLSSTAKTGSRAGFAPKSNVAASRSRLYSISSMHLRNCDVRHACFSTRVAPPSNPGCCSDCSCCSTTRPASSPPA